MIDVNELLEEAIRETENLNDGEVFLVKDLFKGYVWNRIPRKDRLLLGTLFLNHVSKMNGNLKAIEKTSSNQQRYKKTIGKQEEGIKFMSINILVVDDEQAIADLIEVYLKNEGFTVYKFYNGQDAFRCVESKQLELAILDVMLPDIDGFTICRKIREKHNFPVIMLTAKEEEIDKITGLTLGADDYITKPFRPLELVARVKAQLRRFTKYNSPEKNQEEHLIAFSGLVLDKKSHECTLNEKKLSLTPTEFSILWVLCSNRGRVVSSEELFREVWGDKYFSNSNNTVMVHIRHLREKMGDSAEHPKYIKTVWGVGYKIEK